MLVTAGLGRRVIFIVELLTQYISAGSRVWVAHSDRQWLASVERFWAGLAGSRQWVGSALTRTHTLYSNSRSWIVTRVRSWTESADRSHDA